MDIVIVGAGPIGTHIASVFSRERINVTLVDPDPRVLEEASQDIDVATRAGRATDWQLLDELMELSPDLIIAVTGDDEDNLACCTMAKNLGYPRTIARVKDSGYLNSTRLDFARMFQVDYFVGPELLVAQDIYKFLSSPGSLAMETFAHGAVQLRTLVVPPRWRQQDTMLSELNLPDGMMVGLIRREVMDGTGTGYKQVIFPHGSDCIFPGDEVTVIGESDVISDVHFLFGSSHTVAESVVIVGGSLTALHLAKRLEEQEINTRIIDKDRTRCAELADQLLHTTVICQDGTDLNVLGAEKVDKADIVVACTGQDEVNLTIALMAKEAGCERVVAMLTDARLIKLADSLGVNYTPSPRVSAANRILSLARAQTISSMVSLYENQAEIIELNVSIDSKVTGIPISELGPQFPRDFLLAVIQNRGRIMIANGNRVLSPGDTVIVVTNPEHIPELEKVF